MRLSELVQYNPVTIQCHDNPDADALASGYGLYCYFKSRGNDVHLVYSGRNKIQKSNLLLMVEKLSLPVEYINVDSTETLQLKGLLITVDCQAGSGNVTGLAAEETAIIDHHLPEREPNYLSVINPAFGSCATLVWRLLRQEGFEVDSDINLGTALYYGLYCDTNQFSELQNPVDMDMRDALNVDHQLINLFRNSNLSLKELEIAGIAMLRYSYNDDFGFAVIKAQPCDPNLLGLISDFLLQVDAIKTCVVFNEAQDGYKFSVRSCIKEVNSSEMAAFLADDMGSGGGHYEKAGGFISLKKYEEKYPVLHTEGYFSTRLIQYFESYDFIYASEYEAHPEDMKLYRKKRICSGYVNLAEHFPKGSNVVIRSLDGDLNITVEDDLYVMIGLHGKVYAYEKEKFQRSYEPVGEPYRFDGSKDRTFYVPTIKCGKRSKCINLTEYAQSCIPKSETMIYAKPLEKGAKVFTLWDNERYVLGQPGDYLAVRSENLHDVYIIEKDMFEKGYTEV